MILYEMKKYNICVSKQKVKQDFQVNFWRHMIHVSAFCTDTQHWWQQPSSSLKSEQSALLNEGDVIKRWKTRGEEEPRWTSVLPWSSESGKSPAEC